MKYKTAILQNPIELSEFLVFVRQQKIRSYLEIGSKFGGLLWSVANAMPKGSKVASIDLPWGDGSFKESEPHLKNCIQHLKKDGYDAYLHIGNSRDAGSVEFAKALAPFDLVMIDGDHTAEGVLTDWTNYGNLGKRIAFHDINWKPRSDPSKKKPIEVRPLWDELKLVFNHKEIIHDVRDNGIGILWR